MYKYNETIKNMEFIINRYTIRFLYKYKKRFNKNTIKTIKNV